MPEHAELRRMRVTALVVAAACLVLAGALARQSLWQAGLVLVYLGPFSVLAAVQLVYKIGSMVAADQPQPAPGREGDRIWLAGSGTA